jgi:hypothetical protein
MHLDGRRAGEGPLLGLPGFDRRDGILDANLMIGYVWADEPRATACAVVTASRQGSRRRPRGEIALSYWNAREEFVFGPVTGPLSEMLDIAEAARTTPVILADSADNPTGGGVGDRADVLNALIARNFDGALIAGITDSPAVEACFAAGKGAKVALTIGGSLDPASTPAKVDGEVSCSTIRPAAERQAVVEIGGITDRACRASPSLSQYRRFHPPRAGSEVGAAARGEIGLSLAGACADRQSEPDGADAGRRQPGYRIWLASAAPGRFSPSTGISIIAASALLGALAGLTLSCLGKVSALRRTCQGAIARSAG